MGLNPRLRIACAKCDGTGKDPMFFSAPCPACCRTIPGRDADAEARLAELVEQLPEAVDSLEDAAGILDGCGYVIRADEVSGVAELCKEMHTILTVGQPGAEPATKGV